jgi:hypothetical protein
MRKVSAKMVPRILSDDQKQQRLDVFSDLSRQLAEGNNFLDRVITCDESWCFQYGPETKRQSMHQRHRDQKGTHVMGPSEDNAHLFFLSQGHCSL